MTATAVGLTTPAPGPGTDDAGAARRRRSGLRSFLANRKVAAGTAVVAFFAVVALVGDRIAPYDPGRRGPDKLEGPSARHWLGTTHVGQDIFSQVLVGTRSVMLVGFSAALVATAIAVVVGVTSGYLAGVGGEALSALSNVFIVIPALPLIIIITNVVPGSGDWTIALVIGFTAWAWGARLLRAQTMSLRQRDFVQAARATGESTWRILGLEILPNLTAIIAS
jgi:peptide/nickel transport system permease protein